MTGLLILALAAALTACGGSDAKSATTSSGARTAPVAQVSGAGLAAQVTAALRRSGSVTLTNTGARAPQRMLVSYTPSAVSFAYTTPGQGFTSAPDKVAELMDPLTLKGVGSSLFMATNPEKLPRPWLRVRKAATDGWSVFLLRNLSATLRNINPYMISTMLNVANEVWQRPASAGTQHYQLVIRGDNILKVMSPEDAERLRTLVAGLTQVCDVTLDAQNRPLSLIIKVTGSPVTQSQAYSGWGPPVHIDAPDPGSVLDTPQLEAMGYSPAGVQVTRR